MLLHVLARYPFLPEAGRFIEEQGPALDDLLHERVYAGARARGRARVVAALEAAELPSWPLSGESGQRELLEELLSYAYARILVSAMADAYVVRRHALAEAVRVRDFLVVEDDLGAIVAAAQAVSLDFSVSAGGFRAHFTEFLKQAVHLKDLEWKLVRQPLRAGVVEMDRVTVARLIQEALRRRIEQELPRPLDPVLVKSLDADLAPMREAARLRKEKMQVDQFGEVDLGLIPPCMQHTLGQLQRGENVAHSARFAVTSFLHAIGMTPDDIMKLFSQAPDFRESLTRYQVEHITGVTSGTVYSPPSCQAMQTFGICYNADDTCRSRKKDGSARVTHPLNYYRFKVWLRERDKPALKPAPTGA
ncbi:MAG: DNA primase large subunit PriL [Candidatus Thermoplasmatota archaeon]